MRLSPEALTQAVNLAINGHIAMNQTRVQTLSDWKGVADAEATRAGVFAARLARAGLTGPAPIFEGRAGFFKQVSGPFTVDVATFGGETAPSGSRDAGSSPIRPGLLPDGDPGGHRRRHGSRCVDAVQSLRIDTTHLGYITAGRDREKWRPMTKDTADHSLPYITARAMLDGAITNDSYAPDRLSDPALLASLTGSLSPRTLPSRRCSRRRCRTD